MKNDKEKLIFFILSVWCVLWVNFIFRDLLKKGDLKDYRALVTLDHSERTRYVYGAELTDFLSYCKKELPYFFTYDIKGVEKYSLDWRRAIYYLCPAFMGEKPEYFLVLKGDYRKIQGYYVYKKFNEEAVILKSK